MGQRNMRCTSQMLNLEMDQLDQHLLHPETCILLGSNSNFPHHNIHPVLSAPRNPSNIGLHHLPDHHNSGILYGTPYNGLQHHHSMENPSFGVAAASNSYNPYMIPSSGSRIFPNPGNQGSSDQLPSSSNHGIVGVGVGEYESNNHFMNGARGSFKRKNTQGFPGNYQHANSSTSSTSSSLDAPPVAGLHHWDEQSESRVGVLEIEAFTLPEYRGNDIQSVTEGGPQRSVRGRSVPISFQMGSALVHNHPHLIQRNYIGQSFRPASRALVEQQFGSNGGDGGTSTWNHVPTLPYLPGRSVSGGSLEIGNMSEQGYQETTNSRNSAVPFYPSISYHHSQQLYDHYSHHHPPPQMQGLQSHNYSYHQVPAPSYWHLMSNTLHQNVVTGPRHQRPCLPTGFRIYRPHRGVPQEAPEDGNLPRLRLLPEDEVAILDFSGFENFTDHHSDMRLDIDHMSYEELLALEERIGNVNTGLTEESIIRRLKTRTYVSHTDFNLNDPLGMDQETGTCIICQDEYKNLDNIGTLDCEHEYHAECLKKWLLIKNACPICKTSALTVESNDG